MLQSPRHSRPIVNGRRPGPLLRGGRVLDGGACVREVAEERRTLQCPCSPPVPFQGTHMTNTMLTVPVPCFDHRHWFLLPHEMAAWRADWWIDPFIMSLSRPVASLVPRRTTDGSILSTHRLQVSVGLRQRVPEQPIPYCLMRCGEPRSAPDPAIICSTGHIHLHRWARLHP